MASISGFIRPPEDAVVLPAPVLAMHVLWYSRTANVQGGTSMCRPHNLVLAGHWPPGCVDGSWRKFTHQPLRRRLYHGFLPIYLVLTVDGELLACCNASDEGDAFLEAFRPRASALATLIDTEPEIGPCEVWTKWISEQDRGRATSRQLLSGIWRATFGPDAFGQYPKLALTRLGSYVMVLGHAERGRRVDRAAHLEELSLGQDL
jgi:hypothetical protein